MPTMSQEERLRRLERQMRQVEGMLERLIGLQSEEVQRAVIVDEPWMREVRELVNNQRTIDAIRVYREQTGVTLREAVDAVENLK